MPSIKLLALLGIGAACAFAEPLYQFSYQPSEGVIQPFGFEFTSPDFIAPGAFPITPFTITDGTHLWTLTQAIATDSLGFACFEFGSSNVSLLPVSNCGATFNAEDGVALFNASLTGLPTLPTMPGTSSSTSFAGSFIGYTGLTKIESGAGVVSLTIGSVPEPSTFKPICLLVIITFALCRMNRKPRLA